MSQGAQDELLTLGVGRTYRAKAFLMRSGATDKHVVLLLDGAVKIFVDTDDGDEVLLGVRVGGDVVGELAAMDGQVRSGNVVACADLRTRLIGKAELDAYLRQFPDVSREIARTIALRLRSADRRRVDFLARTPRERLARVLVEIAETYGQCDADGLWDLGVTLTQAQFGSLAGMARRTAEKQFAALSNLVQVGYRDVRLVDMAGLRRLAVPDQ